MPPAPGLDFLVDKVDWKKYRFADAPIPEPAAGQVVFRVDRFAFTANNISYALTGDALGYWRFFPAPDGWGRLPTMGFGDVIRSSHPDVAEGTRCFGFYPMSRYLLIEPGSANPAQITDAAAHRKGLAPTYAQFSPVEHDAFYAREHEDALMLMRGLFTTSFLADDFLAEQGYCGADDVLISSASSKTSIALGHSVRHAGRARAVGLTSARNLEFVRKLGCYDQVLTYDAVTALDGNRPTVYVDLAGSGELLRTVHEHFGDRLRHSCGIGATHWEAERGNDALPGPQPEFFFAPAQIQKRVADWGREGLQARLATAWSGFRSFSDGWLEVQRGYGRDAALHGYLETLEGRARPNRGHVLSLWDSAAQAAGQ